MNDMNTLSKEQAIAFAESKSYEHLSHRQIAEFQIQQELLCMPFSIFHEAVEVAVGRPVYTHEFAANVPGLRQEIFEGRQPPTSSEIMAMLPSDKTIIINCGQGVIK